MTTINRPEMAKAYDHRDVEERLYQFWMDGGWFAPKVEPGKEPFCIIQPPPNVTGELHLGHGLVASLSDTLVRWNRMLGKPTLWLPGEDHASIAAQWVMELELAKEGKKRQDLGRDAFLERMWEWMNKYRHIIANQHRRLGVSTDWSRERFTMDPGPSKATLTSFVNYYNEGLIYRGQRIISWCPRCGTSLSDLEVDHEDIQGALHYIKYPLETPKDGVTHIMVATTRPETIPGDVAVAVNPDDPRYGALIGQTVVLPVIGRRIPIVGDSAVEMEFGTGALKITPGHDPVDFEIGQRQGLPIIVAMDLEARMNAEAGPYEGMSREDCRFAILKDLEEQGLLDHIDNTYNHAVGHCYRCKTIVEPIVSEQWFLNVQGMAKDAMAAVEDGRIEIVPERFVKVYNNWMENIRDWCISRQLWWGHRIPAWYCTDCDGEYIDLKLNAPTMGTHDHSHDRGTYAHLKSEGIGYATLMLRAENAIIGPEATPIVAMEEPKSCPKCGGQRLMQDPDVLDTWFSSGLWPHSTLGWPDDTEDLRTFYPTSVMVTGYDILFFWVARMVMMGLQNTGEVPFKTVYLHGLIRDEKGEKMSKSKGNVISPIDTIETYGTDALRFTLATGSSPGNDMKLNPTRLEASRNFANKLWNAARYVISSLPSDATVDPMDARSNSRPAEDRWIVSRFNRTAETVNDLLAQFQLGEAGRTLHDFIWNEYCDWYIEMAKVRLRQPDAVSPLPVLTYVLEGSLRLLHPFMPFVTEEIWQTLKPQLNWHGDEPDALIIADYPTGDAARYDDDAEDEMTVVIEAVRAIRNARAERNVPPSRLIQAQAFGKPHTLEALTNQEHHVKNLARLDTLERLPDDAPRPEQAVALVLEQVEIYLPLAGLIDTAEERARLQKELDESNKELASVQAKLNNPSFVDKAPVAVVTKEREKLSAVKERLSRLTARLRELG